MHVTALSIYPVKSLGQQSMQSVAVEARGLHGDRRLMLVDDNGHFITQRQFPRLCLIGARWVGSALHIAFGGETQVVSLREGDRLVSCRVRVWHDEVDALDLGDAIAAVLTRWAGTAARLVYMGDDSVRAVDAHYGRPGDIVSFADGYPVLMIGQASLDQFNTYLQTPVSMLHLRPNLVFGGAAAFAEDTWKRIRVGEVEFDVVKPCSRCVVPSINPANGEKNSEVLRALAAHRRGSDGKTYFGQNLIARTPGAIHVGDEVVVVR